MAFSGPHIFVIGVVFGMVACAPQRPPKINEVRNYNATFLCDATREVKVSFTPFAAVLESDGISTNLTQQPATDGFLYTGGGQSLRAHGSQATWTDGNGATHQCQERTNQSR